jgi:hypothetical protein
MRRATFLVALVALSLAFQGLAFGASSHWTPFGTAHWVKGAGLGGGYGLVTTSLPSGTYGGISLSNPPADPNSLTALSFDFKPNQTGGSGGSPRLVVQFSDGGDASLRPLAWVAGTWTHEDGMVGTDWDNRGGTCGSLYETTWATIKTCHTGTTVTGIFAVNDSGWLYPPAGEEVVLDNVTVNDQVASGPGKEKKDKQDKNDQRNDNDHQNNNDNNDDQGNDD